MNCSNKTLLISEFLHLETFDCDVRKFSEWQKKRFSCFFPFLEYKLNTNYTQFDIRGSSACRRCSNTCFGVTQWLNNRIKGFFFFFAAETLQLCHPLEPLIKVRTAYFFFQRQAEETRLPVGKHGDFFFFLLFSRNLWLSSSFLEKVELWWIQEAPLESLLVGSQIKIGPYATCYHPMQKTKQKTI